jgi:hypothetical protein
MEYVVAGISNQGDAGEEVRGAEGVVAAASGDNLDVGLDVVILAGGAVVGDAID